MPHATHLHPEWGLLVPPRSFGRTIRVVIIAAAIGVTAGVGVMSSLAERSSESSPMTVERTLVQPASAAAAEPSVVAPEPSAAATQPSAQAKPRKIAQSEPAKAAPAAAPRLQSAAAALTSPPSQKKAGKRHRSTGSQYAERAARQFTSLMDDWYHAVGL